MRRVVAVVTTFSALSLLVTAASALTPASDTRSIAPSVGGVAEGVQSFPRCDEGIALSAGFDLAPGAEGSPSGSIFYTGSENAGVDRLWAGRAESFDPDGGALRVVAYCAKRRPATSESRAGRVEPGRSRQVSVRCPPRSEVAGLGFKSSVSGSAGEGALVIVTELRRVDARTAIARGFNFTSDQTPGTIKVNVNCVRRVSAREVSASDAAGPGEDATAVARCGRGQEARFGGFALRRRGGIEPGDARFIPTRSLRRGELRWALSAANRSPDPAARLRATSYAYCAS